MAPLSIRFGAVVLGSLVACSPEPTLVPSQEPAALPSCRPWLDQELVRDLVHTEDSLGTLQTRLGLPERGQRAILEALFPEVAARRLEEGSLPLADARFELPGFASVELEEPIDWTADPFSNNSWRLFFQDLAWISELPVSSAAHVLVSWADRVLPLDPPLEYTWYDAAVARRIDATIACIDRYLDNGATLDPRVLLAAAKIILTHRAVLASADCYTHWSNHGLMQDLALLRQSLRFPHLAGAAESRELAERRLVRDQLEAVASDGVHIENSPGYHVFFLGLLLDVLDVYVRFGQRAPPEILVARDRLLETLPYFVQSNLTLPLFGDTTNGSLVPGLGLIQTRLEGQRSAGIRAPPPAVLGALEFLESEGKRGQSPSRFDEVFPVSGYAAFRSGWTLGESSSAVGVHFKSGRLSNVHAHDDDTSFELFGYGTELIVDAGHFNFDRSHPRTRFQYSPEAHNILTVDGAAFRAETPARLEAFALGPRFSWVRGGHRHYSGAGVERVARTLSFDRSNQLVVLDVVSSVTPHTANQRFNLHPSLGELTVVSDRQVVARSPSERGPSLVVTIAGPFERLDAAASEHFPGRNQFRENQQLRVLRTIREGAESAFPVLFTVVAPGVIPVLPSNVQLEELGSRWRLSWILDGAPYSFELPRETRR